MNDIRIISATPHPTGSPENEQVRAYLSDRLTTLGMDVQISESQLPDRALALLNRWTGNDKKSQTIYNVIGILPGKDQSKKAVLLMAHHDTVVGSPGAADDTIGIACILEIIRALNEIGPQQRDIIVLFTDGEEVGLSGATHFFETHPWRDRVGAVVNFEARGGGGIASLFQTSAQNGAAARLFADAVKQPSASSLSTFVYTMLPNDTDLTPALKKEYVAYNFANIGRAQYYHSPKITADALDRGTVQHLGSQGLDLVRALATAGDLPAPQPDATFFDLYGFFTLIYAPVWGWVFLLIGIAGSIFSLTHAPKITEILGGCGRMLGVFIIGSLLLFGLNILSGDSDSANYFDRLAAIPKLEALALFAVATVFFLVFGTRPLSENGRLGALIPITLIGVAGQIFAPTATYFISLSVMLCAIAFFSVNRLAGKPTEKVLAIPIAALIFGYMVGLGHQLMLGVGPDMLAVAILPAAISALAISPLYPGLPKKLCGILVGGGLLLSTGMALWIRLDPVAATIPTY